MRLMQDVLPKMKTLFTMVLLLAPVISAEEAPPIVAGKKAEIKSKLPGNGLVNWLEVRWPRDSAEFGQPLLPPV